MPVSDGVSSREVREFPSEMPTPWTHRAVRIGLLGGSLLVVTGCGATGLDWVAESVPVVARPSERTSAGGRTTQASAVIPATAEQASTALAGDARPRLNHTVTLGELDAPSPSASPASAPAVSVIVNNYNTVATPVGGYGYANFGYGRGMGTFYGAAGAPRSGGPSTSGPQAGQSWPAIADHGSSFPYRSAPASPWARAQ